MINGCILLFKLATILTKTTKKILLSYLFAPLLMLLFLYIIYRQILSKGDIAYQWTQLKAHWSTAPSLLLLLVVALAPLNWFWEALKWRRVISRIYPIRLPTAYKAVLTGIAFAMVTPGKVGDFAGRIIYLPNRKKVHAAIATLSSNLIQVIATSCLGILGLIYFLIFHTNTLFWYIAWALVALVVIALITWRSKSYWLSYFMRKNWVQKGLRYLSFLKRYKKTDLLFVWLCSLLRFLTYNIQFLVLANALGCEIPWIDGFFASLFMFWMITMIPSLILSDIGVRGLLATLIFVDTGLVQLPLSLLTASYIIWLLNLILPSIIGSVLLLTLRRAEKINKKNYGLQRN